MMDRIKYNKKMIIIMIIMELKKIKIINDED